MLHGSVDPQRLNGVDGLRAVAMTMVIAQHCSLLPFGWTGVWLFYVISGYVITHGLLVARDLHAPAGERYRFFLWKRFLRIVPVYLFFVLVNVVVFAPTHGGQRLGDLPYLLSFTYNWHMVFDFWPGVGGWGAFGHLWTLSVEQQFYLIFPVLALLVPDRWQTRVMLTLVCLGPLLRWHWSWWLGAQGVSPEHAAFAVYSATHCHFDAFLIGALLARARLSGLALPIVANKLAIAAVLGAMTYAVVYVNVNIETGRSGVQALRNVYSGILQGSGREVWVYVTVNLMAAAALVHVLAGRRGTALLAGRPVAWVGRVSYGGYLFHTLVLWAFGNLIGASTGDLAIPQRIGFFAVAWLVTVGLATVSYRYFEEPLARRWRHAFTPKGAADKITRQAHA